VGELLRKRPAVLDTDIGTDVDDILALVLLAKAPEMRLVGVTTVYGDTVLRARMVRRVLDRLGLPDVPIGIGASETLTGRPVWWAGHEGEGIEGLEQVAVDPSLTAASLLRQAAAEYRGELDLFAIGPLTNVAQAIAADASFASSLHHLYVMGGAFWMEQPEHNIKCDPEAADVVFRSGIPMTLCGLDVTLRVKLREADMPRIREAAGVGPMLEGQIRRWWQFTGANENHLHDPLAVLSALHQDLFRFEQGEMRVELDGAEPGRTHVERPGKGALRLAADVEAAAAEEEIVRRIAGEPSAGSRES
jgi:purine nucleosidase